MPGMRLTTGVVHDAKGAGMHHQGTLSYDRLRARYMAISKRHGTDRGKRMRWNKDEEVFTTEMDPEREYTSRELDQIADAFLREDARVEMCRECGERGEETGNVQEKEQEVTDGEGHTLVLEFNEMKCPNEHTWFPGEGAPRGIGGKDPILFEEHFQSRKRREIYTAVGTPDPSIVAGIYNRVHPQGRKVNSEEQRKRNGASFYR
jgi:hypothetical protein